MKTVYCKAWVASDGSDRLAYNRVMRQVRKFDDLVRAAADDPNSSLDQIRQMADDLTGDDMVTSCDPFGSFMGTQLEGMGELLEAIETVERCGYTISQKRQLAELIKQRDAWRSVYERLRKEDRARQDVERNTPEAQECRRQQKEQWRREAEAALVAGLETVRPHINRMAPPLAERHGKPLDQMKRFIAWHGHGYAEWYGRKANDDAEGSGLADLSVEAVEQQIFDPAEYHRREAASHLAEAERGDAASLIDWDAAVADRWDEFERELEPA